MRSLQPPGSAHVVYRPHSDADWIQRRWLICAAFGCNAHIMICRMLNLDRARAWPQLSPAGDSPTLAFPRSNPGAGTAATQVTPYAAEIIARPGSAADPWIPAVGPR